jgi:putative hydrolase of the HAD superfamily
VLRLLHDNGIKVGIVTNAYQPMWLRDIEIQFHGILDFFPDCRISAADVGYLKPHPAIFQAALNCCGTKADETVFVGDDIEADVAGAQAAGLLAVLRASRRSLPRLGGNVVPDATIKTLTDLHPVLDEWFPGWRG